MSTINNFEENNSSKEQQAQDDITHISQIELIVGIMELLDSMHPGIKCSARRQNAITDAANKIVDAFSTPDTKSSPNMGVYAWMQTDDVGQSSKFMAKIMSGGKYFPNARYYHPRDPSDFGRCIKLLEAEPSLKDNIDLMRKHSEVWDALISNWSDLLESLETECPEWRKGKGSSPITYKKMKELGC